jgi:hypothetical protein
MVKRYWDAERQRLQDAGGKIWKHWGPYLSERQWGTVREDYSGDGNAWMYFPFEQSHSRAYRWGEDGLAGFADESIHLCMSLALWNGKDPILKERLFGLTNLQGNHGEDVKELYYYLDATPSHTYLKYLYKYPQEAFPYQQLIDVNKKRNRDEEEFDLIDTGVFNEDRYFDIEVEYAQAEPGSILMQITAWNRGPEAADLWLVPQVWFRNTWSWEAGTPVPQAVALDPRQVHLHDPREEDHLLQVEEGTELLFTNNQTNTNRLYGHSDSGYFKDAFQDYLINGKRDAVNPQKQGTKIGAFRKVRIERGTPAVMRLRLSRMGQMARFQDFNTMMDLRRGEADQFYAGMQQDMRTDDERRVQRQAIAGLIWTKQAYRYIVYRWLKGDPAQPTPPKSREHVRNFDWDHFHAGDVISMPDKWEYPWFAAWDLAFHMLPFALVDADFAKDQLLLLTREWYMHPNGQLPAYEWNFGDVNPPVHAWACWRVFQIDRKQRGDKGDLEFLEKVFHKLMLNFTWWVNRKDAQGRNIFQGGFLGLDNIGVFDRSQPLPMGGSLAQADGTAWMAMYSLNLMRMALELSLHNPVYQDVATKFFEHFLHIAKAITDFGNDGLGLWDFEDMFYYDQLHLPDGTSMPLRVRSMVGLVPMFAVETLEPQLLHRLPEFRQRVEWFLSHRPDLAKLISSWEDPGTGERRLLSLLRGSRMKKLLRRLLDSAEFLSDYGIRSLSKAHLDNPYIFWVGQDPLMVKYVPGESTSGMFGGNSNWRGPIWMPMNYLIIESLQKFHHYYGDDFRVEHPTGSGQMRTLEEIADDLSARLTKLFLRDASGRRPIFGNCEKQQSDPHFRNHLLFHEYFHGDNGKGLGATHQTGWTALVAKLLMPRRADGKDLSGMSSFQIPRVQSRSYWG